MAIADLLRMSFGPIMALILFLFFLWGGAAIAFHFLKNIQPKRSGQARRYVKMGRNWLSLIALIIFGVYFFKLSTMNVIDNQPVDRDTVIEQQEKYDR